MSPAETEYAEISGYGEAPADVGYGCEAPLSPAPQAAPPPRPKGALPSVHPTPPSPPTPAAPVIRDAAPPAPTAPAVHGAQPYTLTAQSDLLAPVPTFWLYGRGDLPSLAARTGFTYDRASSRYRAPTPYHARLLWCYADAAAHDALHALFPRFGRPDRPRHVPFVMAASDRIICLTSPDGSERPRAAGFVYNPRGRYWQTNDLRHVLPLIDIAEDDLKIRLDAVATLPFGMLTDVTIADLISLPPSSRPGGGKIGEEAEKGAPTLEFDSSRGLYTCSHPAAQGAGFHHSGHEFVSSDFIQAQQLRAFASEEAELRLQVDGMVRTVPSPNMPDPRPVPQSPTAPFPFGPDQLDGIRFMATRRGCIVADEMGIGKTAQAIGLINVECPRLALILAPANLLRNWMAECRSYLAHPNTAAIFGESKDRDDLPSDANVIIASYDMLPRLPILHTLAPVLLICDESQEIKSEETKAGKIIYGMIAPSSGKLVFMTGTPIWNRPQDLWAPLHAIAPEVFPHKKNFMRLYQVNDPENVTPEQQVRLDFMAHLLKSGLMIRRLKSAVLNLPPKVHHVIPVDLPPDVLASLREKSSRAEEIEQEAAGASGQEAFAKHRTLFSELNRLRREVGEAKLDFVLDFVVSFTRKNAGENPPRPPLVFGRHRPLLRRFAQALEKAGISTVILTGDATTKARQKRVDDFQAGLVDAGVGSYDAAGVGYTLIRSCDEFMFEVDYTPALMNQAIDRIHRRGQGRVCNIYWFVVDGTIEARIVNLFVAKDQLAKDALGDHLVGMFEPAELYRHPIFSAEEDIAA